jgi:hypothetical protein
MRGMNGNIMTDFEYPLKGKGIVMMKIELIFFYVFQSQTAARWRFQHYRMNGLSTKNFCSEIMSDVIEVDVNVGNAVVVQGLPTCGINSTCCKFVQNPSSSIQVSFLLALTLPLWGLMMFIDGLSGVQ